MISFINSSDGKSKYKDVSLESQCIECILQWFSIYCIKYWKQECGRTNTVSLSNLCTIWKRRNFIKWFVTSFRITRSSTFVLHTMVAVRRSPSMSATSWNKLVMGNLPFQNSLQLNQYQIRQSYIVVNYKWRKILLNWSKKSVAIYIWKESLSVRLVCCLINRQLERKVILSIFDETASFAGSWFQY